MVDLNGAVDGTGIEGGKTVIRMYYVRKGNTRFSIKEKKLNGTGNV